jgi:hypothetical protein
MRRYRFAVRSPTLLESSLVAKTIAAPKTDRAAIMLILLADQNAT